MKNATRKLLYFAAILPMLGGCDFMQNNVGKYMPTIGEPCNNWQCVTSSGEAESHAKSREFTGGGAYSGSTTSNSSNGRIPLNGSQNPEAATPAPVPAMPTAPAAQHVTPFDMSPEELNNMPNPYGSHEQ